MKINNSSRLALVTGGTRGIGAAIAEVLADSGCEVLITGAKEKQSQRNEFSYYNVDFSEDEKLNRFLDEIKDKKVDILVNNAGINKIAPAAEICIDTFEKIQKVNLHAPVQITKVLLPGMKNRGFGRILNITSIFAEVSKEYRAPYSASKFGLLGFTKAVAAEYAKFNVLVNCLAPGFIQTDLTDSVLTTEQKKELAETTPIKRLGEPEEIANIAAFLTSDKNSFISGQQIIADGGFTSV